MLDKLIQLLVASIRPVLVEDLRDIALSLAYDLASELGLVDEHAALVNSLEFDDDFSCNFLDPELWNHFCSIYS